MPTLDKLLLGILGALFWFNGCLFMLSKTFRVLDADGLNGVFQSTTILGLSLIIAILTHKETSS